MAEEQTTDKNDNRTPESPPKKGGNGTRKRAAVILLVLFAVAFATVANLWIRSKTHVETDNAFIESHVYSISSRIPGNVARVMVRDNQYVKKGDLLVELDPADYRIRVENYAAQLDMARNETSSTYAQVEAAKAAVNSDRAQRSTTRPSGRHTRYRISRTSGCPV